MVLENSNREPLTGKTTVVAIIGYPVNHSLSPLMQNAAFSAASLDYIYVPFSVAPSDLEMAVSGLRVLGVRGFNVTIPHKTSIIPFLDRLDESAEAAGAVNTVLFTDNVLIGFNTDGDGLLDSLRTDIDFLPGDEQIIVLGAGGASRGAIAALCRSGAKQIVICNRSIGNARDIMAKMAVRYKNTQFDTISLTEITPQILGNTSLLLNTTSIGMNGERFDTLNLDYLPDHAKIYDMVYTSSGTPLIKDSHLTGLRCANGIGMLVAQGELAFKIWTGQKPPEGAMRSVLDNI